MGVGSTAPKSFIWAMRGLKSNNYKNSIDIIRKELGLNKYSQAAIEAMLIEETKEHYLGNEDNTDNRLDVDAVLVDFGFLKGYDNRDRCRDVESNKAKALLTVRRQKFLEESTYITMRSTGLCHTYRDLKNQSKLSDGIKSLGRNTLDKIDAVAKYIYNKRNCIEQDMDKVLNNDDWKKYDLTGLACLEETMFPALFSARPEPSKKSCVSDCLNSIRLSSEPYDDVAEDLYEALCGEDEPPCDKWVETWLIKCIQEKFQDTIDKDIMLASFALASGFALDCENDLECRLNQFLWKSIYYDTHPCKSRSPIDHILGMKKGEEAQIKAKLKEREEELFSELVEHIIGIKNCHEHIKNLEEYRRQIYKHHSYSSKPQEILFSRENIELSQKIRNSKVLIQSSSVIALLCMIFSICLFPKYAVSYEEKTRNELTRIMAWGKGNIEQNEPVEERPKRDNDKPFSNDPDYVGELETINGNVSEAS